MSLEKDIERSSMMSLDEIERYELPVSFDKLQELLGYSEVDGLNDEIDTLSSENDELTQENHYLDGEISELNEKIDELNEKIKVLESDNVCNIQKR